MFEYALASGQRHSKWTMLASLTGQCFAFGVVLLIPLIYTERLLPVPWDKVSLPPTPLPSAPKPATAEARASRPNLKVPKLFTAPASIPRKIAAIVDEPVALSRAETEGMGGMITHVEPPQVISSLLTSPVAPPPPAPATPKTLERAPGPVHVSGGVQAAKIIRRVLPSYPQLAKQARISGTVHLIGIIGKDGSIQNLRVVGGHPLLVNAALDAVRQWLYQPTLLSGEPVEVIAPIDVNFTLN